MPLLLPDEATLLRRLVEHEAARLPAMSAGQDFLLLDFNQGDMLFFERDQQRSSLDVRLPAVEGLERAGLVVLERGRGMARGHVTALGYEVARSLDVVVRMERGERDYLDGEGFRGRHPGSYAAWRSAHDRMTRAQGVMDVKGAGADCREALQRFADDLVETYACTDADPVSSHTKNRIRSAIEKVRRQIGKTDADMLDALVAFLDAHGDLLDATEAAIQKMTHSGEGGPEMSLARARRHMFLLMVTMAEIDRTLQDIAGE